MDISCFTVETFRGDLTDKHDRNGVLVACHAPHDNLTPQERKALHDIVIKPADKGGSSVILDRENYKQEGLRQLLNTKYYKEIDTHDTKPICDQINKIITVLLGKGNNWKTSTVLSYWYQET